MSLLGGFVGSSMVGLQLPTRCLTAQSDPANRAHMHTDTETTHGGNEEETAEDAVKQVENESNEDRRSRIHTFIVGTCSVKEENEINLIEYDSLHGELRVASTFSHLHPVDHLSAGYKHEDIIATAYSPDGVSWQATIWRLPSQSSSGSVASPSSPSSTYHPSLPDPASPVSLSRRDSTGSNSSTSMGAAHSHPRLHKLIDLKGHVGRVRGVVWSGRSDDDCVVTLDEECVRLWELNQAETELTTPTASLSSVVSGGPTSACWDPHTSRHLLSSDGRHLRYWDFRAGFSSGVPPILSVPHAHLAPILSVDFNPNRPHVVCSVGEDRRVHIWDLRRPQHPIKTLMHQSHWIHQATFNPHDQIILTAGNEMVNLWNINSVSSAPMGNMDNEQMEDSLVKSYSDHEDSVYGAAWSAKDAFIFATLSYDGRIVVNHVPPAMKFKILL